MALTPYTRAYGNLPLTQITPFTYRDGLTFLQILNEFENWLREIVPELDGMLKTWHDQYVADHEALENEIISTKDQWQELFDAFMLNIIEELEGLNDQAMANLINNVLSQTRQAIDGLFDEHHDSEFFVDIAEFGAKQDGTDSSTAIIAANAEALARGKKLVASGVYNIASMVTITAPCDLSAATFRADMEGVAVTVTGIRKEFKLPAISNVRHGGTDWASVTNSRGLMLKNANSCVIHVGHITGFEYGLTVRGENTGCAYNTVHLSSLWHNKVNLVLDTLSTTGIGYSNQNLFIGGRFQHNSTGIGSNVPGTKHIWYKSGTPGDDSGRSNNNTFLGSSLEGAVAEFAIDFENAGANIHINNRYEYGNKVIFRSNSNDNNLIGGYGLGSITKDVTNQGIRNRWESAEEEVKYSTYIRYWNQNQAFPWFELNWPDRSMAIGVGNAEPRKIRALSSSILGVDAGWVPNGSDLYSIGSTNNRWLNGYIDFLRVDELTIAQGNYPDPPSSGAILFVNRNSNDVPQLGIRWANGQHTFLATQPPA